MKRLITLAIVVFSSLAVSDTYHGKIKRFEGMTVETNRPYSYLALATEQGDRIMVPSLLNAEVLHKTQDTVVVDGQLQYLMCTDMSQACLTGFFADIERIEVFTGIVSAFPFDRFEGKVRRFAGNFVETPHLTYDYFALKTIEGRRISVPAQVDAKELAKISAGVVIEGHAQSLMCTDMSPACGPDLLSVLSSVTIDMK